MTKRLSKLSIIFPFFNAQRHVEEKLSIFGKILEMGGQLIFVNDNSRDNGASILCDALASHEEGFVLANLSENVGAGASRNVGFKLANREFVLFLDIDDRIDADLLCEALADCRTQGCEIQLSRFSLEDENGNTLRLSRTDRKIFEIIKSRYSHKLFSIDEFPKLLRLTNYPWNKIVNTEFARKVNLKFSETRVQNDVFAHWQLLLAAKRIGFFDGVYTSHILSDKHHQITNDFGKNRLQMFDVFDQVERELFSVREYKRIGYSEYLAFKTELMLWAQARMQSDLLDFFHRRAHKQTMLTSRLDLLMFWLQHPSRAKRYNRFRNRKKNSTANPMK
ncbi:glycosyltransferase family 2 protein [Ruegeria marisrubri]|uniref:glycosyltransferase family 2 protein n=1 Tax=Ruegeria marisrubri TaxID=1685379 RepID=UPI0009EA99E7|nr:glycosyltransferase [Ruegeria marisrubri]